MIVASILTCLHINIAAYLPCIQVYFFITLTVYSGLSMHSAHLEHSVLVIIKEKCVNHLQCYYGQHLQHTTYWPNTLPTPVHYVYHKNMHVEPVICEQCHQGKADQGISCSGHQINQLLASKYDSLESLQNMFNLQKRPTFFVIDKMNKCSIQKTLKSFLI